MKEHGIVFRLTKNKLTVSCQCLASDEKHSRNKGGSEVYVPMPQIHSETVWDTYNQPENHQVKFTNKDRINS